MSAKILLKTTFKNPDGVELTQDGKEAAPDRKNVLTARDILIIASTTEFEDDQKVPDQITEKLSRFMIYQKLLETTKETEEIIFQEDELAKLRNRVARQFAVLVSGPMLVMMKSV